MDWLKRNWVDVLMGGLIFAIAAGVLVVLLRGGLFVTNTSTSTSPIQTQAQPVATTTATNTTSAPQPQLSQPSPTPPASTQPVSKPTTKPAPNQSKPTVVVKPTKTLTVPEIPQAPVTTSTSTPNTTTKPQRQAKPTLTQTKPITTAKTSSPTSVKSTKPTSTVRSPATTTTSSTKATKTTYTRADFLRNYRIAAGSYAVLERAAQAARQLRARGLPAQFFSSGNTYVVVVGPYSQESAARVAFRRVRQTLPDAILYRPDGSREAVARKPASQPKSGSGGQVQIAAETAYLQVGAFKDMKSATLLLGKLKTAGFKPLTKNASGLLRVLVGPFSSQQISSTREALKNQGFDAFPVTL